MGAVYMHLTEIGWSASFDEQAQLIGLKDHEGALRRFHNEVSWHDVKETIQYERIAQLWDQAAKHHPT